jgi:hypothetical protein
MLFISGMKVDVAAISLKVVVEILEDEAFKSGCCWFGKKVTLN